MKWGGEGRGLTIKILLPPLSMPTLCVYLHKTWWFKMFTPVQTPVFGVSIIDFMFALLWVLDRLEENNHLLVLYWSRQIQRKHMKNVYINYKLINYQTLLETRHNDLCLDLLGSICKLVHFLKIKILHNTVHISIHNFIFKQLSAHNVT